jgi:2-oxoglutarate ferredoxin oxidoreductase subunit beta
MAYLQERHARGEVVTGLLYLEDDAEDIHRHLNTVEAPLNRLSEKELCPGSAKLAAVNDEYR